MTHPYLRMLIRPATALALLALWSFTVVGTDTAAGHAAGIELGDALITVGLVLGAFLTGLILSFALQEVQHAGLSWSLPGFRRGVRQDLIALWALLALALAGIHGAAGGGVPPWIVAVICALATGCGLLVLEPLGSAVIGAVAGIGGLLLSFGFSSIAGRMARHPLAGLMLAAALLAVIARRTLGTETFRRKPFHPTIALLSFLSLPVERNYLRERMRGSRRRGRDWASPQIRTRADWVRAAIYESNGFRRVGWLGWQLIWAGLVLGMVLFFTGLEALEAGGGLDDILHLAWRAMALDPTTDAGEEAGNAAFWMLPWFLSVTWASLIFSSVFRLRARRVYPISRRRRGEITFAASVWHLATLALTTGGVLTAGALLLAAWSGTPLWPQPLPNFGRAMLMSLVFLPAALWLALATRLPGCSPNPLAMMAMVLGICTVTTLGLKGWTLTVARIGPALELVLFAILITTSLLIYRVLVMRHYARGDLARVS